LGCHGIVKVLLERVPPAPPWAVALAGNFAERRETVLAVEHSGEDRSAWGTRLATSDDVSETGRRMIERVAPPTALVIFGAGDDAQPLARLAKELGWVVTIADPRPAFATPSRFPTADRLVAAPAAELVAQTAPDAATLAVVMTHHYVHDVPILRDLLGRPLAYVGLLGPKKRAERILGDLEKEPGRPSGAERRRLHAPVGLDLGAETPEQVALAILAEMQAVLTGRDARPLRERSRPIHEVATARSGRDA
jgi:xanthine/CO dehydrogenase XdhC/CoxF family maturation factor